MARWVGVCLVAGACIAPRTRQAPLAVAGRYQITRVFVANDCHPPVPGADAPVTGLLEHTPGDSLFRLLNSDGGRFRGRVTRTGGFTTGVVRGRDFDYEIVGRFTREGFSATLTGHNTRSTGPCTNVLRWTGIKVGAPNALP